LALDAATPHLTQFPEDIQHLSKMGDDELNKMMSDPNAGWWPEPMTLIFGKTLVSGPKTGDVFFNLGDSMVRIEPSWGQVPNPANRAQALEKQSGIVDAAVSTPYVELAGPWSYYQEFRRRHGLADLPEVKLPEIGVKAGSTLTVPIVVTHAADKNADVIVTVNVPSGWTVVNGAGRLRLPAESKTAFNVEISTPEMSKEELQGAQPVEIVVGVGGEGTSPSETRLRVLLKASALPQ